MGEKLFGIEYWWWAIIVPTAISVICGTVWLVRTLWQKHIANRTVSGQQAMVNMMMPDPSSHSMSRAAQPGAANQDGSGQAGELIIFLRIIDRHLKTSNYEGAKEAVALALEEYDSRH